MAIVTTGDTFQWYLGTDSNYGQQNGLFLQRINADASRQWAGIVEWKDISEHDLVTNDLLLIQPQGRKGLNPVLEDLCRELLKAGYGRDAALELQGQLTATKAHLEDMRKLIFSGTKA
jgi:hypothetical protein